MAENPTLHTNFTAVCVCYNGYKIFTLQGYRVVAKCSVMLQEYALSTCFAPVTLTLT